MVQGKCYLSKIPSILKSKILLAPRIPGKGQEIYIMLYSCLGPKVMVYLVRNMRRVSVRCAVQHSKFARKMEHFCTFILPDRAAIVTMVDLVDWLQLGNGFNGRCEKWSARKHPEMALSFGPVAVCSLCLVSAWFVPKWGPEEKTSVLGQLKR